MKRVRPHLLHPLEDAANLDAITILDGGRAEREDLHGLPLVGEPEGCTTTPAGSTPHPTRGGSCVRAARTCLEAIAVPVSVMSPWPVVGPVSSEGPAVRAATSRRPRAGEGPSSNPRCAKCERFSRL